MSRLMHCIMSVVLVGGSSCSGLPDAGVGTATIEIPSEAARLELNHIYAKKTQTDNGPAYVLVFTDRVLTEKQLAKEEEKENEFIGSTRNRVHLLINESGLITYLILEAQPATGVSYGTNKIYHQADGRRASIANGRIEGTFNEEGDFGRDDVRRTAAAAADSRTVVLRAGFKAIRPTARPIDGVRA